MQRSADAADWFPSVVSRLPLTVCLVVGLFAGCDAYSVSKNPGDGGVPFYTWKTACRHQTVWILPTYKVTLKEDYLDDKGKP